MSLDRAPWLWSFAGAALVYLGAVVINQGQGSFGMLSAALALAVYMVVVGIGQMFVITLGPGNVDLSLPANIGLASAVAMTVMGGSDTMILPGLAAALACGGAIGLVNYGLIAALRIPPIIATLSVSFVVQSIDISFGRGLQIKPPPGFADAISLSVAGLPVAAAVAILASAGFAVLLQKTVFGREVTAIGQNRRAARLAGIDVARVRCLTYMLCGALGGLNGALLAGYFRGASVDLGNDYLLASIAVVVIGGTSVAGGEATVAGLWGAALFLVFLQIMLNAIDAGAGLRLVVTGLVIVAVITAAAPGRKAPR